jgi:hypothetical protein
VRARVRAGVAELSAAFPIRAAQGERQALSRAAR